MLVLNVQQMQIQLLKHCVFLRPRNILLLFPGGVKDGFIMSRAPCYLIRKIVPVVSYILECSTIRSEYMLLSLALQAFSVAFMCICCSMLAFYKEWHQNFKSLSVFFYILSQLTWLGRQGNISSFDFDCVTPRLKYFRSIIIIISNPA